MASTWSRFGNTRPRAITIDATGAYVDEMLRYNPRLCQRGNETLGARVIATVAGRRHKVQYRKGRRAHALQTVMTVKVTNDRDDAAAAQFGNILVPPRQAIQAHPAAQQFGGTQGDVAAADQQYPDHVPALRQTNLDSDETMPLQITIKPSDHSFACDGGETVLAAAMRADLMIPYGCRNGACGTCKGRILEVKSTTARTSRERSLTRRRRTASRCFAWPRRTRRSLSRCAKSGVQATSRSASCPVASRKSTKLHPMSPSCRSNCPRTSVCNILLASTLIVAEGRTPSQLLHRDGTGGRCTPGTAYSACSGQGYFSGALFSEYKGREILRFEGPLGTFFLREESDKPIIFVAGGTGFAPIKAIIEHVLHHDLLRPITLYWGVRSLRDLYLPDLPLAGRRSIASFDSFQSCPTRWRRIGGPAALGSCTRRSWPIILTSQATRSTPVAARR